MKIAVLSGKGGTGKTTVSVSLAMSLGKSQYIDCDVEEPNGAIFLKPEITSSEPVSVMVPEVDNALCNGCGACAKACRFNALAVTKGKVLVFGELCHHCGACIIACPKKAISEKSRDIGVIEQAKDGFFMQGRLNIGERIALPIIAQLKQNMRSDVPIILDSPPGTSCSAVAVARDCDYCLLVTEPTPFGLHDLDLAVKLVQKLGIPLGVVINKSAKGESIIHDYCKEHNIPILMEILYSREIASNYSNGLLPAQTGGLWQMKFLALFRQIEKRCLRR